MFLSRLTLQMPQATVHSSLVADAWLAWHSMHRSMMWLRQMAQLSTTMSHAQSATAFHCALLACIPSCLPRACAYLLDLEALLFGVAACTRLGRDLCLRRGRVCHVDIGHVCGLCRGGGGCAGLMKAEDGGEWRWDVELSCTGWCSVGGAAGALYWKWRSWR